MCICATESSAYMCIRSRLARLFQLKAFARSFQLLDSYVLNINNFEYKLLEICIPSFRMKLYIIYYKPIGNT